MNSFDLFEISIPSAGSIPMLPVMVFDNGSIVKCDKLLHRHRKFSSTTQKEIMTTDYFTPRGT